jgi:hypothetical protein
LEANNLQIGGQIGTAQALRLLRLRHHNLPHRRCPPFRVMSPVLVGNPLSIPLWLSGMSPRCRAAGAASSSISAVRLALGLLLPLGDADVWLR